MQFAKASGAACCAKYKLEDTALEKARSAIDNAVRESDHHGGREASIVMIGWSSEARRFANCFEIYAIRESDHHGGREASTVMNGWSSEARRFANCFKIRSRQWILRMR